MPLIPIQKLITTYLVLSVYFLVFPTVGCTAIKASRNPNFNSDELANFRDASRSIRLRDGSIIDLNTYKLDNAQSAIIERFVDSDKNFFNKPTREINEILEGVHSGLSFSEALSLYYYTGMGYEDFWIYLSGSPVKSYREGNMTEKEVGAFLLAAISALNKLPKYSGVVHFGSSLKVSEALLSLKPGEPFTKKSFISTSKNLERAKSFSHDWTMKEGYGCFLFTIEKSKSGSDIMKFSFSQTEEEVLFPPKVPLTVEKVTKTKDCLSGENKPYPSYLVQLSEN